MAKHTGAPYCLRNFDTDKNQRKKLAAKKIDFFH